MERSKVTDGQRASLRLTTRDEDRLEALAEKFGLSAAAILRLALRRLSLQVLGDAGEQVPPGALEERLQLNGPAVQRLGLRDLAHQQLADASGMGPVAARLARLEAAQEGGGL